MPLQLYKLYWLFITISDELLDKQKIMYTRLSLSDDPEAIKMKEQLKKSIALMGFPADTDMNTMFDAMQKTISSLKTYLDK